MEFKDTLSLVEGNDTFLSALSTLLEAKADSIESDICDRIPEIDVVIDETVERVESLITKLPKGSGTVEDLNTFFREVMKNYD